MTDNIVSNENGLGSIVKNDFDENEYIVSTTKVETPYGDVWQAGVFLLLPSGTVISTMAKPLLVCEMGDGYVRATTDLKVLPPYKKIQPITERQFHITVMAIVKAKKQEEWPQVVKYFLPAKS